MHCQLFYFYTSSKIIFFYINKYKYKYIYALIFRTPCIFPTGKVHTYTSFKKMNYFLQEYNICNQFHSLDADKIVCRKLVEHF